MNQTRGFPVPQAPVGFDAGFISYLGVRRHFGAALSFGPILGFTYEVRADPVSPKLGFDKPALEITDMIAVTILDKRANARFEKSDEMSGTGIRNQDELAFGVTRNVQHFILVVFVTCGVPQKPSQSQPFAKIVFFKSANADGGIGHVKLILAAKSRGGQQLT
jgi:hypothetical protein